MTTSRPMRADARRNHERLVAAARSAFTEHGTDAPLDDIARRAGVGPGTLYRHFPHREALIEAVYRDDIERLSARAFELAEKHPPGEALALWMREQVERTFERCGLAVTLKAAIDRGSETFAHCKSVMFGAAEAVLTPAQEAGLVRPDVEPRDLLLLAHGLAVSSQTAPESTERLLSITLAGLRAGDA